MNYNEKEEILEYLGQIKRERQIIEELTDENKKYLNNINSLKNEIGEMLAEIRGKTQELRNSQNASAQFINTEENEKSSLDGYFR